MEISISNYVEKNLIYVGGEYNNVIDLFEFVSSDLKEKGFVKDSYCNALKDREKDYPTGLSLGEYSVAIPHVDPDYIHKQFIAVVKPMDSIEFIQMGSEKDRVFADIIFFLGFKRGEEQPYLLQKLISVFNDTKIMKELIMSSTSQEIYELLERWS